MNLNYHYPSIYWAAARLIVESGSVDSLDEDLEILDVDDELESKANSTNYFKMSAAIGKIRSFGVNIEPPNINKSNYTFRVDESTNSIYFGLSGINRIGQSIVEDIINNRPYSSLEDFLSKVKVNKVQATMLIKAGAFDQFGDRTTMLRAYCQQVASTKTKLTLQNMAQLIDFNLIPEHLEVFKQIWRLTKHMRKHNKYGDIYVVDGRLASIMTDFGFSELQQEEEEVFYTPVITWDKFYSDSMNPIRKYLSENQSKLLTTLNGLLVEELFTKYGSGSIADQEMEALSYYYSYHELSTSKYQDWFDEMGVEDFFNLPEEPIIEWQKGQAKKFELTTIVGTAIGRDKQKRIVGLSTPSGFVKLKIYRAQFIKFDRQIKLDGQTEKSWFSKGTHLLVHGYRSGDYFIPKYYKSSPYNQPLFRIEGPKRLKSTRLGEVH